MMPRFGGHSRVRWAFFVLIGMSLLAACQPETRTIVELPTATLQPIASQTPRLTATPVPSNTPLPTFTFTPTDVPPSSTPTVSPTPTMTPTVYGIVQSMSRVNVREGPGTNFNFFTSLAAGDGIQIIGRDSTGEWLNVRLLSDGREGWVSTKLVNIPPTPTAFPTLTPSPDLTSLFLGTPLPTAVLGGGTVTPTPPAAIVTATPIGATEEVAAVSGTTELLPGIPEVSESSIQQTRAALERGAPSLTPSITPTLLPTATPGRELTLAATAAPNSTEVVPTTAVDATGTPNTTVNEGLTDEQVKALNGVDVFAFCDRSAYGVKKPTNLTAGSTIDIYWGWFAREEAQVLQHVNAARITLAVNGTPIADIKPYRTRIRRDPQGTDFVTYWYVPYGPLTAGEYKVTYTVTWDRAITDGYAMFGPGTSTETEDESCTFTVK